MTREEVREWLRSIKDNYIHGGDEAFDNARREALDMANKALEQESCEDCVRRQEVLNVLKDKWNMFSDANDAMQESIDTIEALKPVTPKQEPKAGHWIEVTNGRGGHECDICHEYAPSYKSGDEYLTKYCPNCGAKMERSDKE